MILVTGRVFDVLDVPAGGRSAALGQMEAAGMRRRPGGRAGASDRMLFFVVDQRLARRRRRMVDVRLDCEPESVVGRGAALALPGQLRARPALPLRAGQAARWLRSPQEHPLPDALRLLEYLVDACEA